MTDASASTDLTLGKVLEEYLQTLSPEAHNTQGVYVRKYVEYAGHHFTLDSLTGHRVELYAEREIRASDPAAPERVAALKEWFQFLKKRSYTEKNLGVHIRLRKSPTSNGRAVIRQAHHDPIEMTADGLATLKVELEELEAEVPNLLREVSVAREDKDFRENAPLDAAREALAFNEQRRRALTQAIKRAVVVEATNDDTSTVGSAVTVARTDTNQEVSYTLVSAREANAAERKISIESPVGKQLLGRRPGDEVVVAAPSGDIHFVVRSVARA